VNDYRRYGYGPPPRGYGYYRTDTGDVVLAAIATGVIISLLSN
jgi:Ni/Co efflux regulator RcnB